MTQLEKDNRGRIKIRYNAASKKAVGNLWAQQEFDNTYCYMDLNKYPHINPVALFKYHKATLQDNNRLSYPVDIYEKTNGMHFIRFKENESQVVASLSITKGKRIFTMEDRQNLGPYARNFNQATRYIEKNILGGDGSMQEINPQHVGTHMPGFKVGGMHKHIVAPKAIDSTQISKIIKYLIEKKLIGGLPEVRMGKANIQAPNMRVGDHDFFTEVYRKLTGPLREPALNVY